MLDLLRALQNACWLDGHCEYCILHVDGKCALSGPPKCWNLQALKQLYVTVSLSDVLYDTGEEQECAT